jgi:teichuronic acid biosynthesis glycosyltransferase TuaC
VGGAAAGAAGGGEGRPLAGLHVLLAPSWWPSPEIPIAGIFFLDYARAFAAAGAKVGVVFADLIEPLYFLRAPRLPVVPQLAEESLDGIPVIRVRGVHTSLRRPHRRTLRGAAWLRRAYAHYAVHHGVPHVIHAHAALPGGWGAVGLGAAPVVLTEHTGPFSLLLATPEMERLTHEALRGAAAVCAVSPNLRAQMQAAGVDRDLGAGRDIPVIPNPVAPEFAYAPPPVVRQDVAGTPEHHAVFIARLVREKGVRELGEAAARLAGRADVALHWHLVGDGPERETLRRALGPARATWHGTVPKPEILRLVRESHFLVLPSHGENCPLSVAEALCVGRPVVGTRGTGIEPLVGPEDGALVPIGDVDALATAVLETARGYARWDAAAIAARARARFGYQAVAERYAAAFREVARAGV